MLPWMSRAVRISVQFVAMALRRMIRGLLDVSACLRPPALRLAGVIPTGAKGQTNLSPQRGQQAVPAKISSQSRQNRACCSAICPSLSSRYGSGDLGIAPLL